MQERIAQVLDSNADHVAAISHCEVRKDWVTKTRVGLPNHVMAEVCYRNMELAGAPRWSNEAKAFCREIQRNLGLEAMENPIHELMETITPPQVSEEAVRSMLPAWQGNYTSDDYVDYTWHTPTVRLIVGRCTLRAPGAQYRYPAWVDNALGGYPATIDPTVTSAARCISATIIDLLSDPDALTAARREFEERTGGGLGGSEWVAPLLPSDFAAPIGFNWPEYVTTERGASWYVPAGA